MSLIITPGHLSQRSELYHQIAQLLNAGIGLIQALQTMERSPPARSFRVPLLRMIQSLQSGNTFAVASRTTGNWLPEFDAALLEAGELSGRLPNCFKLLAKFYEERAALARRVISDLTYPVGLFHFAILLGPFPQLFLTGNVGAYLSTILTPLLPLYAITLFLLIAGQGRRGDTWRSLVERVLRWVPILGRARHNLALARLTAALEALVNAGVSIGYGWELAAAASGAPSLRRSVARWRPWLEAGMTPADAVAQSPDFPDLFRTMYATGEVSGSLDESLARLHDYYREEGSRQLKALSRWVPRLIYFAVVLMIAYRILSFYAGYFSQLNSVLQ